MYLGVPPFGQTVRTISEKIAIQDQVDFYPDGGYLPGYIDIDMNGQGLLSSDVIATDGIKVTLKVKANALDEFKSVAYWPVSLIDTYRKSEAAALMDAKIAAIPPAPVTPTAVSDQVNTSTGAFDLPAGTAAQRPGIPGSGNTRLNTSGGYLEYYNGSTWVALNQTPVYTAAYLCVAGGGGGGGTSGGGMGGGGAGGVLQGSAQLTHGTVYTITVGGGASYGNPGSTGSASSISGIVSSSGGGGGGSNASAATSGGSGGGGSEASPYIGAVGVVGQGNRGGDGSGAGMGAGGGGAGNSGESVGQQTAGSGGIGIVSYITGSAVMYGIGGGGSRNGQRGGWPNGGAGSGGSAYGGTNNGTTNAGNGGGGSYSGAPGNGGSGVVILSIPTDQYTGTYTGGPTITTVGANTVLKFTGSGTYTA